MKDLLIKYIDSILKDEWALTASDSRCPESMITLTPGTAREDKLIEEMLAAPAPF